MLHITAPIKSKFPTVGHSIRSFNCNRQSHVASAFRASVSCVAATFSFSPISTPFTHSAFSGLSIFCTFHCCTPPSDCNGCFPLFVRSGCVRFISSTSLFPSLPFPSDHSMLRRPFQAPNDLPPPASIYPPTKHPYILRKQPDQIWPTCGQAGRLAAHSSGLSLFRSCCAFLLVIVFLSLCTQYLKSQRWQGHGAVMQQVKNLLKWLWEP